MSESFVYKIEGVEYKNTEYYKCFIINGWCYNKDYSKIDYQAKINGKISKIKCENLYRKDILLKEKIRDLDMYVGFRLYINCGEETVHDFELSVFSDENQESIIKMNHDEIKSIENTHSISFHIDSISYNKKTWIATLIGWAYSDDNQNVMISIKDESKQFVESSCRKELRTDLLNNRTIDEKYRFCGYRLEFKFEEGHNYTIHYRTNKDERCQNLEEEASRKPGIIKKYFKHINIKNMKKAISYFRRNGFSKLMDRLKNGTYVENSDYSTWFYTQRVTERELEIQRNTKFSYSPKISILVATFNTKEEYLKEMMDTVINQSYSNWQLCIADGSTNDFVEKYVQENYLEYKDKISFKKLDQNYGISDNTNKAFEMATGDYICVYDHDDMLELDCLYEIVKNLQEYRYDVLYTDEDKFDDAKKEYDDPNFKPDFSEDLLRSHNYITHLFVVNKKIVDEVGYYNSQFDGSQDYDYTFRCIEKANRVYHIPRVLYHWRMHPESMAQDPESKMYCYDAGKRAIEAHYQRMGVEATVELMPKPLYGFYHTTYSTKDNPLVSVLIPNYNHKDILKTCIDSLYNVNEYQNFEIVIVENNSTEQEIFNYYDELQKEHDNIRVITYKGEFNYSKINNFGMKYTKGDYVLLLNNDTEIISPNALSGMVGCILRPEVGAVGAKLLYEDDTVQHAGIVVGFIGYASHVNHGLEKDECGYMDTSRVNCNYSAVTAACMMVKKSVFEEVGGFDESFVVACNDVDLCLKICQKRKLVVFNAFSLWHHYESKSRGYDDDNQEKAWRFDREIEKFQMKWKDVLENGDPYYNKNWNLQSGPFRYF